ncbi:MULTISPECIES: hypothetical protein [Methylobacteriaceae]|uniref:hypothetical protein n=1 Tax=Methylobacteriaceae TaxID=119045 RepID=UPI00116B3194|nr:MULTISPECIES: hypothetical protein [Methylobacteriaceae]GEL44424.1 hypothetical protein MEX01_50150 [Methylorubrum extorquens]
MAKAKTKANISATTFDGAEAWRSLDPEAQARIGAAALEKMVAKAIFEVEFSATAAGRAAVVALEMADNLLHVAVLGKDGLDDRLWTDVVGRRVTYRVPSVLGIFCHSCGYSDADDCEDTSGGWASDTLCAACAQG